MSDSTALEDNTLRMSTFAYALLENYEVYGHTEDEYELSSRDTLIEYIGSLENRVAELEAERLELRKILGWAYDLDEYKDNPEERER